MMKKFTLALVAALAVANVQAGAQAPKKSISKKLIAAAKANPAKATAAIAIATYFSLFGLNATAKYFNKLNSTTAWLDGHLFNPLFGKKYTTKNVPVEAWFDKAEKGAVVFSMKDAKAVADKNADVTAALKAKDEAEATFEKASETVNKAAKENADLNKLSEAFEKASNAIPEDGEKDANKAAIKAATDAEAAYNTAKEKFFASHPANVTQATKAQDAANAAYDAIHAAEALKAFNTYNTTEAGKKAVKLMLAKDGQKSAAKIEDAQTTKVHVNGFVVDHAYLSTGILVTAVALLDVIDQGKDSVLGKLVTMVAGKKKATTPAAA